MSTAVARRAPGWTCPAKVESHPLWRIEEVAMSGNKQRRFTDEFKREAVRLIETNGRSVQRVAHNLGIAKSTLSHWRSRRCDVARKKYQDDGCRIARHTRRCRGILTYQEARSEPRDLCRGECGTFGEDK